MPTLCSRRHFLQANGFGLGTLALASLLRQDGLLAAPVKPADVDGTLHYDLLPKQPHFEPTAKAMILLFQMGGPAQMDMFDPKPMLTKYDGQNFPGEIKYDNVAEASRKVFGSPWKFAKHGQCGTELSELLPGLAQVVDDITLIRRVFTRSIMAGSYPAGPPWVPGSLTAWAASHRISRPIWSWRIRAACHFSPTNTSPTAGCRRSTRAR
jgi:hypothetical protein